MRWFIQCETPIILEAMDKSLAEDLTHLGREPNIFYIFSIAIPTQPSNNRFSKGSA